jgi:hypothetical protein
MPGQVYITNFKGSSSVGTHLTIFQPAKVENWNVLMEFLENEMERFTITLGEHFLQNVGPKCKNM